MPFLFRVINDTGVSGEKCSFKSDTVSITAFNLARYVKEYLDTEQTMELY